MQSGKEEEQNITQGGGWGTTGGKELQGKGHGRAGGQVNTG